MRRATPDSEAMGSSEDEKPWPSATTFGSLPRKENGVPGLGGGIWATQSRGSFTLNDQARRIAAREARSGGGGAAANMPYSSARSANTPSPATSEGANALPFAIPLQPTSKAGRSLSHSQGQREMPSSLFRGQDASGGMERGSVLPLGLLNEAEEVDTESESELGAALTQTTSHPPIGSLQRTSTYPAHYDTLVGPGLDKHRAETFNESLLQQSFDRRFESAFGNLSIEHQQRRPQWHTSLGWEELPSINESRRHSLADIPTRRGSVVGVDAVTRGQQASFTDHINHNHLHLHPTMSNNSNHTAHMQDLDLSDTNLPEGYRVTQVSLQPHERGADRQQMANMPRSNSVSSGGRATKMLYIVSFKCSRVGVFYLLDNTGLEISEGDLVIVEADRGQDLGMVQNAEVTASEARTLMHKYAVEQYKWLMMFSSNNKAGAINPNAGVAPNQPAAHQQPSSLKPRAIKRLASKHEIQMLREKEGNEAKAKRCCQQKVAQHHLQMEILEAEFQWDWNKLTFYYYADHYINFRELVNDLYKLYKVRLWMSAVNPASFSSNAINQPPSGIGPGAVGGDRGSKEIDNSYSMAYGTDPDPYGAVPPYKIGYNTYVPNYPAIPGIPSSFSPIPGDGMPTSPGHGQWPTATGANITNNTAAYAANNTATYAGNGAAKNNNLWLSHTGLNYPYNFSFPASVEPAQAQPVNESLLGGRWLDNKNQAPIGTPPGPGNHVYRVNLLNDILHDNPALDIPGTNPATGRPFSPLAQEFRFEGINQGLAEPTPTPTTTGPPVPINITRPNTAPRPRPTFLGDGRGRRGDNISVGPGHVAESILHE